MTTTDRTGADTATFEARMTELDRLEVADVAADVALQRVLDLADEYQRHADLIRAQQESTRTVDVVERWRAFEDAGNSIRLAVAGPQRDHDEEGGQ